MTSSVIRLGILGLAVYFYLQGKVLWAAVCVAFVIWLSFRQQIAHIVGAFGKLTEVPQEHSANSELSYSFGLDGVFEHPAVDQLFAKLQTKNKAPAPTLEEWRKLLAENYCRKYKREKPGCEVRFNVKNNLLFVNGDVEFGDHIYYQLEIPYRWTDAGEPERVPSFSPESEYRLAVRVLLVNGILRLEVGGFDKEYSPAVFREGSMAVYEDFATVTTFPLMYFTHQHGIPVRYLNLVAEATPAYKAWTTGRSTEKNPDMYRDWRSLHAELATYRILCDTENENYGMKRRLKLEKAFEEKRIALLNADGYKTPDHEEEAWRYPDTGHWYSNRFGRVFFWNRNNYGEGFEGWFADYTEEQP